MEYFVFRNNTIEIFFGASEFEYSGYGDISFIPTDATSYIWFYQVPFKSDIASLVGEISEYFDKLRLVYQQLPENRQLIVFTLENLFPLKYSSENYELTQEIERFNSNIYSFSDNDNAVLKSPSAVTFILSVKMLSFIRFTLSTSAFSISTLLQSFVPILIIVSLLSLL